MTDVSERIDHAAEAVGLRSLASDAATNEYAAALLSAAQVHATLALVEQQRIANLIALSQATNADGSRVSPWALTHPVNEYDVAVNDGIREGLGLND